jgi:Ca2+-binding EF-hand superfamily protein
VKIKPTIALVILSAIFALFGALGVAIGNYSGNTLVDAFSGLIGNAGNLFGILAIVITCTMDVDKLYVDAVRDQFSNDQALTVTMDTDEGPGRAGATIGFILIIAACCAQFLGGVFACIGTCQEISEVAKLAQQVKLRHDLEEGPPKTRAEKAHLEHDKEDALARERYENMRKREEREANKLFEATEDNDQSGGKEEEGERPKRHLPALQKVLFRNPENEEDECPQSYLVDAFAEIDGDGSGSIEMDELIEALSDCNIAVSKNAADTIMKEIDKNASGDIDMREFIQFFRRIEELKAFDKKNQARQQFATFLANFCFLADTVVVGVMLMLFIKMDETEDPEGYAITKNVMMACIAFLVVLFLLVILAPILRLSFGPTVGRLTVQYEMAKEIKRAQKKMLDDEGDQSPGQTKRQLYSADDPPPPVNAAMFGRSYRPGMVSQEAWAPPELQAPPQPPTPQQRSSTKISQPSQASSAPLAIQDGQQMGHTQTMQSTGGGSHPPSSSHSHVRKGNWKYDPAYYTHAREFGEVVVQENKGPMSWSPMQIRSAGAENNRGLNAPNVPHQLSHTAMPGNMMR